MKQLQETVPVIRLSKEEAKRIIKYAQETYFRHMRLYEFVFNNNSENEMKRINFKQEAARTARPLGKALQISEGRPKKSTLEMTTDDEGSVQHDNDSNGQVKVQENEIEQ